MAQWLRLVFAVFALVGLLAGGTGGAYAAKSRPDHCAQPAMADMAMAGHHHGGDDSHGTAAPDCCLASLCAVTQPNLPPHAAAIVLSRVFAQAVLPAIDDAAVPSPPLPPNLRPPIA